MRFEQPNYLAWVFGREFIQSFLKVIHLQPQKTSAARKAPTKNIPKISITFRKDCLKLK